MLSNRTTSHPTGHISALPQERRIVTADLLQRPLGPARRLALLTRSSLLPAMVMPVLWGTALAWWQTGRLDGGLLALMLLGQVSLCLGLAALVHYHDHRRSRQFQIALLLEPAGSGFHLLVRGLMQPGTAHSMGLMFITIGMAAIAWLVYLIGWPMLFFGGLGLLLTFAYATPPVYYGYRGWGLGEVGLFLGFGFLPAISAFYVQTHTLNWLSLASSIPLSLMAMLTLTNDCFLHWRRDWKLRKRTPAVMLGPRRALDVCTGLVVVAFATVVLLVGLGQLPVLALLGLAGMPPVMHTVARIHRHEPTVANYIALVESTANTTLLLGGLLMAALWLDRLA